MRYLSLFFVLICFYGCKDEAKTETLSANDIINKSIEISGGKAFENSVVRFDFRDKYYVARRNNGNFSLVRMFADDKDSIFDLLANSGFERLINDERVKIADSMKVRYSASVNSVHYFSVLPYGLNDTAVNKTLIGEEQIKAKTYYKVKVTFNEQGGGEDFEDVFIYWVNKDSFKVDYLAYSYNEDDGKGIRFRAAYNERYIDGLRFVDYNNYKPENDTISLNSLGKAYDSNNLKLLSKIELKNIEVELIDFQ